MKSVSEKEDTSPSQTVKAQVQLRELILNGDIKSGERVAELNLVERLGVSRTPVRAALVRLEEEGLLQAVPTGGYRVKHFSDHDIRDAIELRGTLEGLAARFAAERGATPAQLSLAHVYLERIDAAIADPTFSDASFSVYVKENDALHTLLLNMANSPFLSAQLERMKNMPFVSPGAFVKIHGQEAHSRELLLIAQHQHRSIVEAIAHGEGGRAEALAREHVRIAIGQFEKALKNRDSLSHITGHPLIHLTPARPI